MKKKILSTILCFAIVVAAVFVLLPTEANAENQGNLTYAIDGLGAMVYGCDTSVSGEIVIPSSVILNAGVYPVTGISSYAFANCTGLTGVIVPNSVSSIGFGAFSGCSSLKSMTIPFVGGSRKTPTDNYQYPLGYIFGTSSYTGGVKIRQSYIATHSTNTFDDYYIPASLESVTVTGGHILGGAFVSCDSLVSVTLGDGVASIEASAFSFCDNLTSIEISNSVTSIGGNAFQNCTSLNNITIPDSVTSIGSGAFQYCHSLTEIIIPDSVTTIGGGLFYPCDSLTSVSIGNGVTTIGNQTFLGCDRLTSVTLGDNITTIGDSAFSGCSSLPGIIIPDSVTTIGKSAFSGCSSLTSVTLGNSVTTIGKYAFKNCGSLTDISIPDSATTIGNQAFYGCNGLKSVTIGNGDTTIGDQAFYSCAGLTNLTIGNGAKTIGVQAFYKCGNLTDMILGNGVTAIGNEAFYYCSSLTDINIPDSVTTIGNQAFYGCTGMTGAILGNSVTTIGDSAFRGCTGLTEIIIPNSVTTLGASAFSGCKGLISLTIGNGVTTIGGSAFNGCTGLTEIIIPDSVTTLGASAFSGCKGLISLTIGNGVTTIGDSAFNGCTGLTGVTIPDSVTTIGDSAFKRCTALTNVTVGDSVTGIGASAFAYCSSLTNITIPDSITRIGSSAFYNCSKLSYNIFENGKYLGNADNPYCAFAHPVSTSIVSVNIHADTKMISDVAFSSSTKLTDVYYCGEQEAWDAISIGASNKYLLSATLHLHDYREVELIAPPTFTSSGEHTLLCSLCAKEVTEIMEMLVGEVSHWNIALAEDLRVNFYMHISQSIADTARVCVDVGNTEYTLPVADLEKTEDGFYIARVSVAAAQIKDEILVVVNNDGDYAETESYTVRGYADTILADEEQSQYHALVKELLNYGAMAQMYFDYDTQNLANDGITGVAKEEVPQSAEEMIVTDSLNVLDFYGASLVYRDRIAVRFYFTGNVTGMTFTANGNSYTPVAKDGRYYIEVADILPQNLDQQITLTATDANGNALSVTYGPMNYIVRMNQKEDQNTKDILKALYNYHLAAKALNAEIQEQASSTD